MVLAVNIPVTTISFTSYNVLLRSAVKYVAVYEMMTRKDSCILCSSPTA